MGDHPLQIAGTEQLQSSGSGISQINWLTNIIGVMVIGTII